jgi:hypothetical protein
MAKKKLLLVVGAGASVDFGMPSVWDVGDIINAEAQQRYPLAKRPHTNLCGEIRNSKMFSTQFSDLPRHTRRAHIPQRLAP